MVLVDCSPDHDGCARRFGGGVDHYGRGRRFGGGVAHPVNVLLKCAGKGQEVHQIFHWYVARFPRQSESVIKYYL